MKNQSWIRLACISGIALAIIAAGYSHWWRNSESGKIVVENIPIATLKSQADKAAQGDLGAAEALRAYYCMHEANAKSCEE